MSRPKLIIAAVLFAILAALVFFFLRTGVQESFRSAPPATTSTAAEQPAAGGAAPALKTVTLFFPREDDGLLVPEEREIPADPSPSREAEEALAELIKGPRGDLIAALPPETQLSRVFITRDGTAYADFSRELAEKHPSGTDAEIATVYSIVDTLAFNFPSIKKVFLLVDGEERETLSGHLSLDRAYLPDYNLTVRR
jgi:spore germination protein GerM